MWGTPGEVQYSLGSLETPGEVGGKPGEVEEHLEMWGTPGEVRYTLGSVESPGEIPA